MATAVVTHDAELRMVILASAGWIGSMAQLENLLEHILMRRGDADVHFGHLCQLLKRLGFDERIRGDHHIFTMVGIEEILNLQPRNGKGKPYQVSQVRNVILRYRLTLGD